MSITDNNTNDAIKLSYTYPTNLDTADKSIEITIKYVKIATAPLQSITATIKLIDEDNNTQNVNVETNNSNILAATGDNIITIISCILISLLALVLCTIYLIKNKANKKSTKLPKNIAAAILVFGLVPAIVIAATSKDIQFIIEFGNIKFNGPYIVAFNTNTQDTIPSQTINHNELATKPQQDPQKPGYTFSKWLDEANQEFDFTTTKITTNRNLKADYTLDTYTISYDLTGGTEPTPANPTRYTYEDNDITLTNPTKDHYDFAGWITPTDNTSHLTVTIPKNSTGNKSYIATWTEKSYTVTFDANGGTPTPQPQTIKYQQYATEPTTNPSKNGYNFKGWQLNNTDYNFTNTKITGDITLTANYEPTTYSITYDLNGGTAGTPANPTTYTIGSSDITLTNPTKPNHTFKGWTGSNGATPQTTVTITQGSTGDKSYTANWNPIYTITLDPAGGTVTPTTINVENGDKIGSLPTPVKDHYDFAGWYLGTTKIEDGYTVTDNQTLTAHYTPKVYTITYNLNGGTLTTSNPTTYTIETPTFTLYNPTLTGQPFKGWTGSNGTTPQATVAITQGTTGNLTYEAIFTQIYTVTFNVGDGTLTPLPDDRQIAEGDPIGTLPANPTPPDEYRFDGWYVGTTKINASYIINENTEVKAGYTYYPLSEVVEDLDGQDVTDPGCTNANRIGQVTKADDPFGNTRFVGDCPSNYVWYNCKTEPTGTNFDYAGSCERWRIIGTFKDIEDGNGNKANRIKIMRADSIGEYSWDSNVYKGGTPMTGAWGHNQWGPSTYTHNNSTYAGSDLFVELNGDYLNYTKTGTTTWYNGRDNKKEGVYDYKNSLSAYAQSLTGNAKWYTATLNITITYEGIGSTLSRINVKQGYQNERSIFLSTSEAYDDKIKRTLNTTAVVGLISPSDFGYSTTGGTYGRTKCIDTDEWIKTSGTVTYNEQCYKNSWIYPMIGANKSAWTLNRSYGSGLYYSVYMIGYNFGRPGSTYAYVPYEIFPSVFLKSDVRVTGGYGSYAQPFTIDSKKVIIKD